MAAKSKKQNPFVGCWSIVSMSTWDEDYLNEEEQTFIEFEEKGSGEFHFGYVHGRMDCRLTTRNGEPAVEWTWEKVRPAKEVFGKMERAGLITTRQRKRQGGSRMMA